MADEVTKKDLQSLQGYCNKQIADATKRLEGAIKSLEDDFKSYKKMKGDYELSAVKAHNIANEMHLKTEGELQAAIAALAAVVNQHAKVINELSK